jgi:hypothetical protein
MMKHDTLPTPPVSHTFSAPAAAPVEIFYVVLTAAVMGERAHRLCSPLYETRAQADAGLAALERENRDGLYSVWKSVTYVDPAEWLHRVVRSDGTLILTRLNGTERFADLRD